MSLAVEPNQLAFARPFTQAVRSILTLRNTTNDTIAFKVKTTAPKQYCVRPNSGHIGAGQIAEIEVILQPMREDPPLDARCRDKFMVQSVAITRDEVDLPMQQLWTSLDDRNRHIEERKLRCVFLPPGGQQRQSVNGSAPSMQNGHHDMAASRDEMASTDDGHGRQANRASSYALAYSDDTRRSQGPGTAPHPSASVQSISSTNPRANTSRDLEGTLENLKMKLAHYDEALQKARKEAVEAKTAQAQAEMTLKQRIGYQKAVDSRAAEARVSSSDSKSLGDQKYSATLVAIVALIAFLIGVIFF